MSLILSRQMTSSVCFLLHLCMPHHMIQSSFNSRSFVCFSLVIFFQLAPPRSANISLIQLVRIFSDPATLLFFIWILICRLGSERCAIQRVGDLAVPRSIVFQPLVTTFKLKLCTSHLPSSIPESFSCMLIPNLLQKLHLLLKFR